jgi:hypothetical protein
MGNLKTSSWIGIVLFMSIAGYLAYSCNAVSNYRKEIRYDDCVVNEFNLAWRNKIGKSERDRRILEVCRGFAPKGPLTIDASHESFIVIRGPKSGYLVCWRSSDASKGIDGTLWVQKGLDYK